VIWFPLQISSDGLKQSFPEIYDFFGEIFRHLLVYSFFGEESTSRCQIVRAEILKCEKFENYIYQVQKKSEAI
jgi:hypothetical protein